MENLDLLKRIIASISIEVSDNRHPERLTMEDGTHIDDNKMHCFITIKYDKVVLYKVKMEMVSDNMDEIKDILAIQMIKEVMVAGLLAEVLDIDKNLKS